MKYGGNYKGLKWSAEKLKLPNGSSGYKMKMTNPATGKSKMLLGNSLQDLKKKLSKEHMNGGLSKKAYKLAK